MWARSGWWARSSWDSGATEHDDSWNEWESKDSSRKDDVAEHDDSYHELSSWESGCKSHTTEQYDLWNERVPWDTTMGVRWSYRRDETDSEDGAPELDLQEIQESSVVATAVAVLQSTRIHTTS